jgi:hypothetical protein
MSPERRERPNREPFHPTPLPEELVEFLEEQPDYLCLPHGTNLGTIFLIKAPAIEIAAMPNPVRISVQHGLFEHPRAPVVGTVIRIYDKPDAPLAMESFTNIDDPVQREDFAALAHQKQLWLLLYDEQIRHRLTKQVPNREDQAITGILEQALKLRRAIPDERFGFDAAKLDVMRQTHL